MNYAKPPSSRKLGTSAEVLKKNGRPETAAYLRKLALEEKAKGR